MKIRIGPYPKHPGKQRKIRVKIQRWDTWSLDHTLALIIHPALIAFRASAPGVPGCFTVEGAQTKSAFKAAQHAWHGILDEMIFAFGEIATNYPGRDQASARRAAMVAAPPAVVSKKVSAKITAKTRSSSRSGGGTPARVVPTVVAPPPSEPLEAYEARIEHGLALFAKYYTALWT